MPKYIKPIIPNGADPRLHEIKVTEILAKQGRAIIFLVPKDTYKQKTPDIVMDGEEWEIKSPQKGNIEKNLKKASRQSQNIIIYSGRTKEPDGKIERTLRKKITEQKKIKKIIFITKTGKIVDITK
jgi:hypothetical protein